MNDRVCLLVVFNHRYDQNLDKLVALYRGRFEHIRFLVPAYTGTREDVIGVLENATSFQGYFSQGFARYHDPRFTHYVFTGDDAILSPRLDAAGLVEALGLDERTGYVKTLVPLSEGSYKWARGNRTIDCVVHDPGIRRYAELLPAEPEWAAALARHGLATARHFGLANLRRNRSAAPVNTGARLRPYRGGLGDLATLLPPIGLVRRLAAGRVPLLSRLARSNLRRRELPVPLVSGYSDFIVVPSAAIAEFARLCGVFAAMNLFVEVAIPTALALACERLRTEADTGLPGLELWKQSDIAALEARCGREVARLPAEYLYTHPVKLSRWTV